MANAMALVEHDQSLFSRLNLDVLKIICDFITEDAIDGDIVKSLDGLSKTNHLLRELCLPALFRAIAIVGSWDDALERLTEMQDSTVLDRYTRDFKFDQAVKDKKRGLPEKLPSALATRLVRMPQLQKLALVIPEHHSDIFGETISGSKISLPAVHTLVVGPVCEFAVQMCPNVTTIANNGWLALRATRGGRTTLQAIHDSVPGLRRLTLGAGSCKKDIEPFIPILSRFTELEYLAWGDTSSLGVGFNPTSGNCKHKHICKKQRERLRLQQRDVAERKVAAMVATACPSLKDLWFGNVTHVEVLGDKNGSFKKYILHRP